MDKIMVWGVKTRSICFKLVSCRQHKKRYVELVTVNVVQL